MAKDSNVLLPATSPNNFGIFSIVELPCITDELPKSMLGDSNAGAEPKPLPKTDFDAPKIGDGPKTGLVPKVEVCPKAG